MKSGLWIAVSAAIVCTAAAIGIKRRKSRLQREGEPPADP